MPRPDRPSVSVIIPTYNRRELVRKMLHQLTLQSLPADEFEVIVSDDGSSDGTESVVQSFSGRLRLAYHFQENMGFRAGTARNAGARLAKAPVLVFVDAGAMVGPDFLRAHLAAHERDSIRRAVAGYAWGFNPSILPVPGLAEALEKMPPAQVLARFRSEPDLRDVRHDVLAVYDFDLDRCPLPWTLFFTVNFSVRADDFWAIEGFDESFTRWGAEDLELALRLSRLGLSFRYDMDAWIIEWPHERDISSRRDQFSANMDQFLRKFPEPVIEIGCLLVRKDEFFCWRDDYTDLLAWTARARDIDVSREIAGVLAQTGSNRGVAVVGAGANLPANLPPTAILLDFDGECVDRARRAGYVAHHSIGIRTILPDQSVDLVILTSRLTGLWERWGEPLMAEAHRIARSVHVTSQIPVSG
jgi:glycosyltransferase involved in cell wall biosynthesis